MSALWWTLLGVAVGVAVMVPVVRVLLARGERRAREAERQARDAQRLAELGAMTSGLAHEIKNPLSTVGLNAQLLGESLREADLPEAQRGRLLRRLESLGREVDRLGGILNDFLQFAGRMKLDPQPHDLVGIVDELSDFFLPQCNQARVTLRTQLPPAPVTARVDLDLFKQALLNLMINAVQAMSDRGDDDGRAGELILRVDPGDGEARIHVTDTGPGVGSPSTPTRERAATSSSTCPWPETPDRPRQSECAARGPEGRRDRSGMDAAEAAAERSS